MKQFFNNVLNKNSGVSSKRFITLIAFLLMAIGFISNLFWDIDIAEFIYDSMKWIVIGGLGFTASEQFTNRNKSTSTVLTPNKGVDITQTIKKEEITDEFDDDDDEFDDDETEGVDLKIR